MNKKLSDQLKIYFALLALGVVFPFSILRGWLDTSTSYTIEVEAHEEMKPTPSPSPTEKPKPTVEEYIIQVFGEVDGERGLKMLKTCENSTLNPTAINWNSNGTWDFGTWQVNQIHGYTQEELSDPYFNTDVAYKIYKNAGNSFYPWTCSYTIGEVPFYLR